MARFFKVVILAGFNCPEQGHCDQDYQYYRNEDQKINYFHGIQGSLFILDALPTTINELNDIPAAAIHGMINPANAAGNIIML